MTLNIFNPEHDLALASALDNFTAPHAGRQLRHDLAWTAALWTHGDDDTEECAVLVDDTAAAHRAAARRKMAGCRFVDKHTVKALNIDRVETWGWDAAIRSQLIKLGIGSHAMPTAAQIEAIRQLSHRRTAAMLLTKLQGDGTVGEARECSTAEEATAAAASYGRAVIKAPWSSSGRGVRFVDATADDGSIKARNDEGWLRNTIRQQGSVMVEPLYNKTIDLAMEFYSDGRGTVTYSGLSLFHTQNGAYTGNIIATEHSKRRMISRYPAAQYIDAVCERICLLTGPLFNRRYAGPFGIDMMIVEGGALLHPCVELNLRRTMGHVALALLPRLNQQSDDDLRHIMRIDYEDNQYKLRIKRL